MDPCGTPDTTGSHSEDYPSIVTLCSLSIEIYDVKLSSISLILENTVRSWVFCQAILKKTMLCFRHFVNKMGYYIVVNTSFQEFRCNRQKRYWFIVVSYSLVSLLEDRDDIGFLPLFVQFAL